MSAMAGSQICSRVWVFVLVAYSGYGSVGCSDRSFDPALKGSRLYLCTTIRFNENGDALDANYAYPVYGKTLPLGTRVHVRKVGSSYVTFTPASSSEQYGLELRHGAEVMTPAEYFAKVLCMEDPAPSLDEKSAEMKRAILGGYLRPGMTKDEAILARGHPPAHVTPSEQSDEWVYFQSHGFVDRVRFAEDRIVSIETVRAP